jgi:hypothetical protein
MAMYYRYRMVIDFTLNECSRCGREFEPLGDACYQSVCTGCWNKQEEKLMPFIHITIDAQSLELDFSNEADITIANAFCDALYECLRNEYPSPNVDISVALERNLSNGGQVIVSGDDTWEGIASGGRDSVLEVIRYWVDRT